MRFLPYAFAAGLAAAIAAPAAAQTITGAGATFPFPVYAKWAEAYNKETGVRMNYQSIGSGVGRAEGDRARPTPRSRARTCRRTAWSSSRPCSAASCR